MAVLAATASLAATEKQEPRPGPPSATDSVPVPVPRPDRPAGGETAPAAPVAPDAGKAMPDTGDASGKGEGKGAPAGGSDEETSGEKAREKAALPEPPPVPPVDPACMKDLAALGARFDPAEAVAGEGGCGFVQAIELSSLPGNIAVEPPALFRCETAMALARWVREEVEPAAAALSTEKAPVRLKALRQASAYVCRLRNNAATGRISQHALGTALDIRAFLLSDGRSIAIAPRDDDHSLTGAFQRAVRGGACLHFTTVLGPGSDGYHEDHLHIDIAYRRGGYRICQ